MLGAGMVSWSWGQKRTRGGQSPPQEKWHREPQERERATLTGELKKNSKVFSHRDDRFG